MHTIVQVLLVQIVTILNEYQQTDYLTKLRASDVYISRLKGYT